MENKKINTMFLLGQYGSGKDTHGDFIADMFGFIHLSFSQLLSQDERACFYIKSGQLVPDADVFRILGSRSLKGYVLNGFPRTLPQLDFVFKVLSIDEIAIVYLDVTDDVVIHRMTNRIICNVCGTTSSLLKGHSIGGPCKHVQCSGVYIKRPDDTPENIIKRIVSFREKTLPIVDEAERSGIKIYRIKIMEEQPIEKTQEMIAQTLSESIWWVIIDTLRPRIRGLFLTKLFWYYQTIFMFFV